MTGNFEIFVDHMTLGTESIAIRYEADDAAALPDVLAAAGIADLAAEPLPEAPGYQPLAVWTGTTPDGRAARIVAWEDLPFGETAIGHALASGTIDPQET